MTIGFDCKATAANISLLLLFVFASACEDSNSAASSMSGTDTVSEFLLHSNGLAITLLTDDAEDETYYFDSYTFNFSDSGTVSAANADRTVEGTYAVFRDDGRVELRMSFPNTANFAELNDDWYFISIDQGIIKFDDEGDRLWLERL
ncbi:hypothetical protein [Phaeodactylibacter luteus]|uniref:Lipocalin-like domain-containing protein n=1 Tax=Phaeodactylibacter luteus TaxID=1564516 RepID=A0A5C6S1W3_9BACT|nr:hypothetical protein [Phaeodactylibacter luteus]TXB68837.1 hypothetical protein FRY97_01880 [Phaeodactylibacter luteus]